MNVRDDKTQNPGLHDTLGIKVEKATPEEMILTMQVTPNLHQPMGILHGGASVALAEGAASMGAFLNCDSTKEYPVGMEINANHLRAMRSGLLKARAIPLHLGRKSQVWEIKIHNEEEKLICISRCTMAIVPLES